MLKLGLVLILTLFKLADWFELDMVLAVVLTVVGNSSLTGSNRVRSNWLELGLVRSDWFELGLIGTGCS